MTDLPQQTARFLTLRDSLPDHWTVTKDGIKRVVPMGLDDVLSFDDERDVDTFAQLVKAIPDMLAHIEALDRENQTLCAGARAIRARLDEG